MTVTLAQTRSGYFQEQSAFVGRLVEFAASRNAVVHLVAHPRKVSGEITGDVYKRQGVDMFWKKLINALRGRLNGRRGSQGIRRNNPQER